MSILKKKPCTKEVKKVSRLATLFYTVNTIFIKKGGECLFQKQRESYMCPFKHFSRIDQKKKHFSRES